MKLLVTIFIIIFIFPQSIFAKTGSPAAQLQEQRLIQIKSRCTLGVDSRVKLLNNLSSRVSQMKKLSETQKTALFTQISSNVTGLLETKSQCESDANLESAKTNANSVISKYRIYTVLEPQIRLLVASDTLETIVERLYLVNQALSEKTKSELLLQMKLKLDDAKKQYLFVQSSVLAATPEKFNSNSAEIKTVFNLAQNALKTGDSDVREALLLAKQIKTYINK